MRWFWVISAVTARRCWFGSHQVFCEFLQPHTGKAYHRSLDARFVSCPSGVKSVMLSADSSAELLTVFSFIDKDRRWARSYRTNTVRLGILNKIRCLTSLPLVWTHIFSTTFSERWHHWCVFDELDCNEHFQIVHMDYRFLGCIDRSIRCDNSRGKSCSCSSYA